MDIQITVADVKYPAPDKKQGKVIDQTGKEWQVWGDKLAAYHVGGSYIVRKYKTSDFRGKTYYTIEDMVPSGGSATTSRAAPTEQVKFTASAPVSDNERRMDIFVCGAFNNLMANSNVNPAMLQAADMIEFVKRLKATWVNTLGPDRPGTSKRAQDNSDINDELPEGF